MTSPQTDVRLGELRVDEFLARLASSQPVPGGGSAAAMAGAMAAALVRMVALLTIGRPRYQAYEAEMYSIRDRAEELRSALATLAHEDTMAYQAVISAYALPRAGEIQAAARADEIQRALRHAAQVPAQAAAACAQVIELAAICRVFGNQNASSDAAVAALLAHAAMRGAALNVRTNLDAIQDEEFCAATEIRLGEVLASGEAALPKALAAGRSGE
jgi:formiminotetrahydrofolate cyclodeaminase